MRENIAELLELANYSVATAQNGKIGIEKVRQFEPDIIICDIMMPEMDGYGVLSILSKDAKTACIPFIFMTAKSDKNDVRIGMNMGADDYITKPFEEIELLNAIENRLKKSAFLKKEFKKNLKGIKAFYSDASSFEDLKNLSTDRKLFKYLKKRYIYMEGNLAYKFYFIQSGKIIYDYGDTHEISYIASVRKSLLSMLYGNYVENGKIDLDKTLEELKIDDVGELLDIEKQATILDILQSKSGVFHAASNPGGNEWLFPERGSKTPGTYFIYNNWDFNVAGYIFEQETGRNIYDAFQEDIANKISFQQWDRTKQKKSGDTTKSRYKAYHFDLSTRDMARIGYLMLRKGKWKDEQVILASWVESLTTITTSYADMYKVDPRLKDWSWWKWGQGLMWRIWDSPNLSPEFKGAYTATGNAGQYITIIPSMDLVVALKTKAVYGRRTNKEAYEKFLYQLFDAKK